MSNPHVSGQPSSIPARPIGGRNEIWWRGEERVHVPVGQHETVAYELLAQMLTDLGWEQTS